jgi:hypothetical protein
MGIINIDLPALTGKIKNPKLWAIVILSVVIVGGGIFWWASREKRIKNSIISRDNIIADLRIKLTECQNLPSDTVYIERIIELGPTALIHPKPIQVRPSAGDTIVPDCPRNYYNDTLKYYNYKINFEALGCLRNYRILKVTLLDSMPVITQYRTVIAYDTAWLPAKIRPWRWGLDGSVIVNSFSSMPGLGVGIFTIFQEKLILGLGPTYFNGLGVQCRVGYIIR